MWSGCPTQREGHIGLCHVGCEPPDSFKQLLPCKITWNVSEELFLGGEAMEIHSGDLHMGVS